MYGILIAGVEILNRCCLVVVLLLQRELSSVQEMRDHQVAELQRQTEENVSSKQAVLDKKVMDCVMVTYRILSELWSGLLM